MLLTTADNRAALRSDLSTICGDFKAESDAACVALFCCLHKPLLSAEKHNALNLGARGKAPQTSINGNAEEFSSPVLKYPAPSIDVGHPVRRKKAIGLFSAAFLASAVGICRRHSRNSFSRCSAFSVIPTPHCSIHDAPALKPLRQRGCCRRCG